MQTIDIEGKPYVLLPRAEYDRLRALDPDAALPALPAADADGNYPAVEYARAGLARKLIRSRLAAGLTQRDLAALAGIRIETISRLESGKHSPNVATVDKIARAIAQLSRPAKGRSPRRPS